jgi:hypothetical protein
MVSEIDHPENCKVWEWDDKGFQKFAGIPFGLARMFESLMPQQPGANRRKNRSIQVKDSQEIDHKMD